MSLSARTARAIVATLRPSVTDNGVRWAFVAAAGLVSVAGLWALGITVAWESLWPTVEFAALILIFAWVYSTVGMLVPRLGWSTAVVSDLLLSVLQILVVLKAFVPLTYFAAASGAPLLDGELARFDALLFGFEWDVAARWVADHPALDRLLQLAYFSIYYQAAAVFLIGSVARPNERNGEIIWQFCIGIILTCMVFVFTPALGHLGHVGMGPIETLTMIRNGQWTVFDFAHVEGIITFPSFHTTLAILLVYAVRHYRWALAVFVPLNMLLIVATVPVGGHYVVDLPAGAAVAVVSIAATRLLRQYLAGKAALTTRSNG